MLELNEKIYYDPIVSERNNFATSVTRHQHSFSPLKPSGPSFLDFCFPKGCCGTADQ